MRTNLRSLAKDTAIYGISSILGRFLNWCLTPLHVYIFTDASEYGQVSLLYGYVAVLMVLLTYGMETGFFRFVNAQREEASPQSVYTTTVLSLGVTSGLFILFSFIQTDFLSAILHFKDNPVFVQMMCVTVGIDAFLSIPFAYLRYQKRPIRFAVLKLLFVLFNVAFNLFFLVLCPWLELHMPASIGWFYNPSFGIGYIFLANMLSTIAVLLLMTPYLLEVRCGVFSYSLLKKILRYSLPLLLVGMAGVVSQTVAQLTYPYLFDSIDEARRQIGVFSACLKITVVITMFTQAFRYAYEPFIFAKQREGGTLQEKKDSYAMVMKYFVFSSLLVFVCVMFSLDWLQYFVSENYREGIRIIPIAMMGEIFFGIYFNLSVWYKLTDNTQYGAFFSVLGCVLQLVLNILLVPMVGYIATAWATLISNMILVMLSYYAGRRYYPINYYLGILLKYFAVALAIYFVGIHIPEWNKGIVFSIRAILVILMLLFGWRQMRQDGLIGLKKVNKA